MESNLSFSIDFFSRKCKANKKRADIYARITVNGEQRELSIKEQIDFDTWDNDKEMVRGRSIEVKGINEHIDNVRFRIKEKYRELETNQNLITAESIRDAYLGVQAKLRGHKLLELTQYYKKIWEQKLKDGGFKNYKTTIAYIELFLAKQFPSGDIYLSQLNNEVATELSIMYATIQLRIMILA